MASRTAAQATFSSKLKATPAACSPEAQCSVVNEDLIHFQNASIECDELEVYSWFWLG